MNPSGVKWLLYTCWNRANPLFPLRLVLVVILSMCIKIEHYNYETP